MKNTDIAEQMARETGLSPGAAADQLDDVITSILKTLKKGRAAHLPGLGKFRRDVKGALRFTPTDLRGSRGSR
jgi:nucleoid DNA-binding protein